MDNEKNIPIDIHSGKLLDWLISRRHCKRDWQSSILIIREKINSAIQDMPAVKEIAELLAGAYINYFHCLQIMELLRETESGTKNIFGQYSSKRMKDWQEIIALYEKDNVYLAEAAQMLIRNVNYEVPSLKKQISTCQQVQKDLLKKEGDYLKASNDLKDKFFATCKQIGIQGNDVKKELLALLDELPEAFEKITKMVKNLNFARDYYIAFLSFTIKRDVEDCLPLLKHLIIKGNTTTYEWMTGIAPEVIEGRKPCDSTADHHNALHEEFDLQDNDVPAESKDDDVDEIDWGISVDTTGVSLELNEAEGRVARGDDALTVLDNQLTRNLFFNELLELGGFLEQRLSEMRSDADILSSNQFQAAPPIVHLQTSNEVEKMLHDVQKVIADITDVKMQHLYLISGSTKYVDRLTESLKHQLILAEKMLLSKEAVLDKQKAAVVEINELEPKLMLIIQKTKQLQKQIESVISKQYKNRPVNIMGGINVM